MSNMNKKSGIEKTFLLMQKVRLNNVISLGIATFLLDQGGTAH